ncbi:MAG: DUF4258 domain-containing protein [Chloroflexi bacterium]|nr:DUF4258 domain-containing protein [Chloroflexota bacterium]
MGRSAISRIKEKIRLRQYDMSAHAMEEMAEDGLDILDIEHAILKGRIARTEKDDPRGTKYVVNGTAFDYYRLQDRRLRKKVKSCMNIHVNTVMELFGHGSLSVKPSSTKIALSSWKMSL